MRDSDACIKNLEAYFFSCYDGISTLKENRYRMLKGIFLFATVNRLVFSTISREIDCETFQRLCTEDCIDQL